jgi:hypothetical protein
MRKTVGCGVALLVCGMALPVWADDEDDVTAAMDAWRDYPAKGTTEEPGEILELYAEDAVLWGTISSKRRDDPAAIRDYFVNAYKALPGLTVTFRGPQHPGLRRRYRGQHRLLHVLVREGRRDAEPAGALQLHPGQARRRLGDRRSPLLGDAGGAEVAVGRRDARSGHRSPGSERIRSAAAPRRRP